MEIESFPVPKATVWFLEALYNSIAEPQKKVCFYQSLADGL